MKTNLTPMNPPAHHPVLMAARLVLAALAIKGELKLKEMVTKQFMLEEINEAMEAMENRKIVGRWVCDHNSL